jgi:hypothetical protein
MKLLNQDEAKDNIIWKCNNTKKIDQIMVEEVYLWIMLSLNSHLTFLFPKINLQQNWIKIYECLHDKFYMQNVILSMLHDFIHNIIISYKEF